MEEAIKHSDLRATLRSAAASPLLPAAQGIHIDAGVIFINPRSVFYDSLCIFSAHAGPILLVAVLVFAAASVLAVIRLPAPTQFIVWSLIFAPARGIVTWIALHGISGAPITASRIWRSLLARWPAALIGSLVYTALIATGSRGLSSLLAHNGWDVKRISAPHMSWRTQIFINHAARSVALRSAAFLIAESHPLIVGMDLIAFVDAQSHNAEPAVPCPRGRYISQRNSEENLDDYLRIKCAPPLILPAPLLGLGSLALLAFANTVLRMQTAAVMRPGQRGVIAPLAHGVHIGFSRLGVIAVHTGLLRLGTLAVFALCVAVPATAWQAFAMPYLSGILAADWTRPAGELLLAAGTAMVSSLFLVFDAVYDARLFLELSGEASRLFFRSTHAASRYPHPGDLSGRARPVRVRQPSRRLPHS